MFDSASSGPAVAVHFLQLEWQPLNSFTFLESTSHNSCHDDSRNENVGYSNAPCFLSSPGGASVCYISYANLFMGMYGFQNSFATGMIEEL